MARSAVKRRLCSLAVLEAVNVVVLPVGLIGVLGMPTTAANLTGLALTLFILLQGSVYWTLKHRQVTRSAATPAGMGVFRWLDRLNVVTLAAGLIVVAAGLVTDPGVGAWPGLALWLFAVAEHINYFHRQLMHDTRADIGRLLRTRRLRTASLARDLGRGR